MLCCQVQLQMECTTTAQAKLRADVLRQQMLTLPGNPCPLVSGQDQCLQIYKVHLGLVMIARLLS